MRHRAAIRSVLLLATTSFGAVTVSASTLQAQRPAPLAPRAEFRIAAPLAPTAGIQAGVGAEIRAGWYARVGLGITAGWVEEGDMWVGAQEASLTARFLFDPYGERARGLYGGAGLGLRTVDGASAPAVLLVLAGIEGAAKGRVIPAFEVVLGGGVRVQGVLRMRREDGR
jgi:hypothetical protein